MHLKTPGDERRVILLEENFRAPRDHLFRVWTEAESLSKWFYAEDGWTVTEVDVGLEAGGSYLIAVSSNGETGAGTTDPAADMRIRGSYIDVAPPEFLSYTWNVEALGERETFVVTRFYPDGDGSRLVLSHGLFQDERETELHAEGWRKVLGRLHHLLAN